jgi:branched-chain amino acid transport system permease protein
MSGYWAGILTILAINIIFAYGIFLSVASGQLNLGGAGFQAVGAYAAAYLSSKFGATPQLTVVVGALGAGALGWLIAYPILRTKGVYLVLATFGIAEVISGFVLNSDVLGGPTGITVPHFIDWYVPAIAAVAVSIGVFYLMSTRFGLNMRATHDDEVVTDLMGVNVRGTKVAAFAIGAALAGFSGGLYAHAFNFVEIQTFGAMVSIYVLLFVLLGGTQTPWGPIVGAVFFTILPEFIRPVLPLVKQGVIAILGPIVPATPPDESWRFVILGICTVVMMALRPEGLITSAMIERLRRGRARRSKAEELPA